MGERRRLIVTLPLPPSTNHLYWTDKKGRRHKTTEAVTWIRNARHTILEETDLVADTGWPRHHRYEMTVYVYFEEVDNAGWYLRWAGDSKPGAKQPHRAGDRRAKDRWKKIDLGERRKLLEDTVTKMLGLDDSSIFSSTFVKMRDADNPRALVEVREIGDAAYR